METPTTASGLRMYDHLPPSAAALAAWDKPGRDVAWHRRAQEVFRSEQPQLAFALDVGNEERVRLELRRPLSDAARTAMPLIARAADRMHI